VLYLHLSPLLSSSFSHFKILSFLFNFFFRNQLNSTCSHISQNSTVSHILLVIAWNVFTNRQSLILESFGCLEQIPSACGKWNYFLGLWSFWSLKQINGP
jgi:hypothetical protein